MVGSFFVGAKNRFWDKNTVGHHVRRARIFDGNFHSHHCQDSRVILSQWLHHLLTSANDQMPQRKMIFSSKHNT